MTAFQYAVLQFVPDPARLESINVGVIVADPASGTPAVRTLKKADAARLKWLGASDDIGFLTDIADDLSQPRDGAAATIALLTAARQQWNSTLRVSELRAALHEDAEELCEELYNRYVANPRTKRHAAYRDRGAVRRRVTNAFRVLLPKEAVRPQVKVRGNLDTYKFDVGLGNGHLLHAVTTLSFEAPRENLQTDVDASAWAIQDVHAAEPKLPVTVVTFGSSGRLEAAERIYRQVGARLVYEAQIDEWVRGTASQLQPHFSALDISGDPAMRRDR